MSRSCVMPDAPSPCLDCGACCAAFRVSFYWAEADDAPGGWVPGRLTEQLTAHRRCMLGTSRAQPLCVALEGTVGAEVRCTIYEQRPSPCREFEAYSPDGAPDPRCQGARAKWGLPPLSP